MKSTVLAAAAVMIAAGPAAAEGFYADVGAQIINISEVEDIDADINLGAITGHAGYAFNDNFAVEAEAGIGVAGDEASGPGYSAELDLNYIIGAFGRVQAPVSDRATVFARAGIVNAELEASASGFGVTVADSQSETGAGYGVGADILFTDRIGVRVEYTRYDIEQLEADTATVGLSYRF